MDKNHILDVSISQNKNNFLFKLGMRKENKTSLSKKIINRSLDKLLIFNKKPLNNSFNKKENDDNDKEDSTQKLFKNDVELNRKENKTHIKQSIFNFYKKNKVNLNQVYSKVTRNRSANETQLNKTYYNPKNSNHEKKDTSYNNKIRVDDKASHNRNKSFHFFVPAKQRQIYDKSSELDKSSRNKIMSIENSLKELTNSKNKSVILKLENLYRNILVKTVNSIEKEDNSMKAHEQNIMNRKIDDLTKNYEKISKENNSLKKYVKEKSKDIEKLKENLGRFEKEIKFLKDDRKKLFEKVQKQIPHAIKQDRIKNQVSTFNKNNKIDKMLETRLQGNRFNSKNDLAKNNINNTFVQNRPNYGLNESISSLVSSNNNDYFEPKRIYKGKKPKLPKLKISSLRMSELIDSPNEKEKSTFENLNSQSELNNAFYVSQNEILESNRCVNQDYNSGEKINRLEDYQTHDFHDDFMSQIEEFSPSWRNQCRSLKSLVNEK